MIGRLLVGTSGWSYDDWDGVFYPTGLERSEWLGYYTRYFRAVELNVTFYRLPFINMVTSWARKVPKNFVFAAKGPRIVTHRLRLKSVNNEIEKFYSRMSGLPNLEVVLWQLPPSLHCDPNLLKEFLTMLPLTPRPAIEFRHPSWWENEETKRVLNVKNAAFCGISHPKLPSTFPDTADFAYIRFHGLHMRLYDYDYNEGELQPWVMKVTSFLSSGRDVYVFFNNDYHANAVRNARTFEKLVLDAL